MQLRLASTLNFRNSDSHAAYKLAKIAAMVDSAKGKLKVGSKMVNEADDSLDQATNAFIRLDDQSATVQGKSVAFQDQIESDDRELAVNYQQNYEAQAHSDKLDRQANELKNILDNAKVPAGRALDAANAYDNIFAAVNGAQTAAKQASEASALASSMVSPPFEQPPIGPSTWTVGFFLSVHINLQSVGVSDKATQSRDRTQSLYDAAVQAKDNLGMELGPRMNRYRAAIKDIDDKNRATKQATEAIVK